MRNSTKLFVIFGLLLSVLLSTALAQNKTETVTKVPSNSTVETKNTTTPSTSTSVDTTKKNVTVPSSSTPPVDTTNKTVVVANITTTPTITTTSSSNTTLNKTTVSDVKNTTTTNAKNVTSPASNSTGVTTTSNNNAGSTDTFTSPPPIPPAGTGASPATATDANGKPIAPILKGFETPEDVRGRIPSPQEWKHSPRAEFTEQQVAKNSWPQEVELSMDQVEERVDDIVSVLSSYRTPVSFPPSFIRDIRANDNSTASVKARNAYVEVISAFYQDVINANRAVRLEAKAVQEAAGIWGSALNRLRKTIENQQLFVNKSTTTTAKLINTWTAKIGNIRSQMIEVLGGLRSLSKSLDTCAEASPRVVKGLSNRVLRTHAGFTKFDEALEKFVKNAPVLLQSDVTQSTWANSLTQMAATIAHMNEFLAHVNTYTDETLTAANQRDAALKNYKSQEVNVLSDVLKRLTEAAVGTMGKPAAALSPTERPKSLLESEAAQELLAEQQQVSAVLKKKLVDPAKFGSLTEDVHSLVNVLKSSLNALGAAEVETTSPAALQDAVDPALVVMFKNMKNRTDVTRNYRENSKKLMQKGRVAMQKLIVSLSTYMKSPLYPAMITQLGSMHKFLEDSRDRLARVGALSVLRAGEMKTNQICPSQVANIEARGNALLSKRAALENVFLEIAAGERIFATRYVRIHAREQDLFVEDDDDMNPVSLIRHVRRRLNSLHKESNRLLQSIKSLRKARAALVAQLF